MTRIIQTKYMFDLEAKVSSQPLGELPDGFRVDLRYTAEGSKIATNKQWRDADWSKDDPWKGISGQLLSGSDRMTVSKSGVVRLNGRATLAAAKDDRGKPFLIDMLYSGVIDLVPPGAAPDKSDVERGIIAYNDWLAGRLSRLPSTSLPVVMSITFELARFSENWSSQQYQPPADYERYARLGRGQYVAEGTFDLVPAPYSPVTGFKVAVREVDPRRFLEQSMTAAPTTGGKDDLRAS